MWKVHLYLYTIHNNVLLTHLTLPMTSKGEALVSVTRSCSPVACWMYDRSRRLVIIQHLGDRDKRRGKYNIHVPFKVFLFLLLYLKF